MSSGGHFYKLISNSSNKKLDFLSVQTGCLQDLYFEADFIFFFKYVNNIQKYAYSFL